MGRISGAFALASAHAVVMGTDGTTLVGVLADSFTLLFFLSLVCGGRLYCRSHTGVTFNTLFQTLDFLQICHISVQCLGGATMLIECLVARMRDAHHVIMADQASIF